MTLANDFPTGKANVVYEDKDGLTAIVPLEPMYIDPATGDGMVLSHLTLYCGPATATEGIVDDWSREWWDAHAERHHMPLYDELNAISKHGIRERSLKELNMLMPILVNHGWIAPHNEGA